MNATASCFDIDALMRVETNNGRLIGKRIGTVSVFKGIPYAAPPVGALRWQPPQPRRSWEGDRTALDFGPAPMQVLPPSSSLMYRLNHDDVNALVMSEDCLYLNVWSPDPSPGTNLPVLVWIHGGANKAGHGGQDLFDGSHLAARGIVVVTVNMRLGALGFLSLPALAAEDSLGASGNYGALDVAAALRWVQDNIAAFGGDAAKVTLAGNSAGAATVTHLMAAPGARGLFRAAIGQSASGIFRPEGRMMLQREAAELGLAAVSSLGSSLEQLRALPATALLGVASQGVIVDGRLLMEDTTDVFMEGWQAKVPLLVGWNADEGSLYASPSAVDDLKSMSCSKSARAILKRTYPLDSSEEAITARRALIGDQRFIYPVWRWARTHTETADAPTWLYQFNHRLPLPDDLPLPSDGGRDYGAFHTSELPYTWDNLATRAWAWSDADHHIAQQLADAWARFVVDGDPNGSGLPQWNQFDAFREDHLMMLGTTMKSGYTTRREAFDVFDEMYFQSK